MIIVVKFKIGSLAIMCSAASVNQSYCELLLPVTDGQFALLFETHCNSDPKQMSRVDCANSMVTAIYRVGAKTNTHVSMVSFPIFSLRVEGVESIL